MWDNQSIRTCADDHGREPVGEGVHRLFLAVATASYVALPMPCVQRLPCGSAPSAVAPEEAPSACALPRRSASARTRVTASAKAGEMAELQVLVGHPGVMEYIIRMAIERGIRSHIPGKTESGKANAESRYSMRECVSSTSFGARCRAGLSGHVIGNRQGRLSHQACVISVLPCTVIPGNPSRIRREKSGAVSAR